MRRECGVWRTPANAPVLAPSWEEEKMKICIVGASGQLGRYMVSHSLDSGYDVIGVCREQSVPKLADFADKITIYPGATDDRDVISKAVAGSDGVLVVLAPWGMKCYASGTAQAVLDYARPDARLVFSCGWHITGDNQDRYASRLRTFVNVFGFIGRITRFADLDDQVEATNGIFASERRGRSCAVGISKKAKAKAYRLEPARRRSRPPRNRTRRIDFALFMVEALMDDSLIHEAPAIVGCATPSAIAHAHAPRPSE
jgi:NmrA-like family